MQRFALIALGATLAACSANPVAEPRTAKAETRLREALDGKVAGRAVSCLPPGTSSDMTIIDDNTILFRRGAGSLVYRNDPPGGCSPLGSGFYALVTTTSLSSLCSGDIARVVDTANGMTVGSCSLGDFVPYRTAGR